MNVIESLEYSLRYGLGSQVRADGVRQAIVSFKELIEHATSAAERLEGIKATGVIARDNKRLAKSLRDAIVKAGGSHGE